MTADVDLVDRLGAALLAGEPVVVPTDTVYGLAALPSGERAAGPDAGRIPTERAEQLVHVVGAARLARARDDQLHRGGQHAMVGFG